MSERDLISISTSALCFMKDCQRPQRLWVPGQYVPESFAGMYEHSLGIESMGQNKEIKLQGYGLIRRFFTAIFTDGPHAFQKTRDFATNPVNKFRYRLCCYVLGIWQMLIAYNQIVRKVRFSNRRLTATEIDIMDKSKDMILKASRTAEECVEYYNMRRDEEGAEDVPLPKIALTESDLIEALEELHTHIALSSGEENETDLLSRELALKDLERKLDGQSFELKALQTKSAST